MQIAILPLADIVVKEDRQRQVFDKDALLALALDIRKNGILQPSGIDTLDTKGLVYGERRLRACRALAAKGEAIRFNGELLPVGHAPFINCATVDPLELEELELAENAVRQDLTWQENTRAISRIKEILEARKRRDLPEGSDALQEIEVPVAEIAAAAKTSLKTVYEAIDVTEHLDDPDVAKAKTKKEAQKIIAKKKTAEHRAQVAASTVVSSSDHKIYQGDCRDVVKQLPDKLFTAIVTDPPYGIDMHKDQSWDGTWHEYDDTEAYCFNLIGTLLPEWDRVTADQAHVYIFCDFSKFDAIKSIVEDYRRDGEQVFDVMYFPFIWDKGNVASYPRPEHWPRKSYECILYAIKGGHKQAALDLAVINVPQLQNQEHPAGKPLELYERLVLRSTLAGDAVLDCFAGQGNLLRACRKGKRKSVSIELSDTYYPLLVEAYNEGDKDE